MSMLLFSLLNLRITKNAVNIGAYGLKFIIVISEIVVSSCLFKGHYVIGINLEHALGA